MDKIDFVVTWVDGNDPKWLEEKKKYTDETEDPIRFRDWDLLRYWFRGVEKFAPWVNCIYFVTWGHVPEWLEIDHPKIKVVKHSDFIPTKYLPTYNSNVIYLNAHKIPGLSENFVIFDDDVFLTGPTEPTDFFKNGLPCESALIGQLNSLNINDIFPHTILNASAILNTHFDKQEVVKKHWKKYYSLKYGKDMLRTLLSTPFQYFSCFRDMHICASYQKSTFEKVWELENDKLTETMSHRFRSIYDIPNW